MKLTLRHVSIRSTNLLDTWIENQIIALKSRLQIDEANIQLTHRQECSPAYQVNVHLVTPGPDVFAEGNDHTLRAAVNKVMGQLKTKLADRATRRVSRLRSRLSAPPAKTRDR